MVFIADLLLSSPIMRAKQTAEKIATVTGLAINYDDRIVEIRRPVV